MNPEHDWKNEDGQHLETSAEKGLLKIFPWLLEDIKNIINNDLSGKSFLEIGCGPGFMLQNFFLATNKNVFAVDISLKMLRSAAIIGRAKNAIPIVADVEHLPFTRDSFDIIFSRGSIFFWKNTEAALQSIFTILKPGGTAVLGGGYGLATPQALIDEIKKSRPESKAKIPRLDLDNLLATADKTGGKTEIRKADRRGFWLVMKKE